MAAVVVGTGAAVEVLSRGPAGTATSTATKSAKLALGPAKQLTPRPGGGVSAADVAAASEASALAVSPGRGLVAVGYQVGAAGGAGFVQVWSVPDGKWVSAVPTDSIVAGLGFSPDGETLGIATAQETLLWNLESGTTPRSLPGGALSASNSLYSREISFSPDGKTVAANADDDSGPADEGLLWSISDAAHIPAPTRITDHAYTYVENFALSPDGRSAAYGSSHLTTVTLATGEQTFRPVDDGILALAYSPDGKHIVTVGTVVRFWDAAGSGGSWAAWQRSGGAESTSNLSTDVTYSHGGAYVVVPDLDSSFAFFDGKTGKPLTTFPSGAHDAAKVGFLPEDKGIAYCGRASDTAAGAWIRMFA